MSALPLNDRTGEALRERGAELLAIEIITGVLHNVAKGVARPDQALATARDLYEGVFKDDRLPSPSGSRAGAS